MRKGQSRVQLDRPSGFRDRFGIVPLFAQVESQRGMPLGIAGVFRQIPPPP